MTCPAFPLGVSLNESPKPDTLGDIRAAMASACALGSSLMVTCHAGTLGDQSFSTQTKENGYCNHC